MDLTSGKKKKPKKKADNLQKKDDKLNLDAFLSETKAESSEAKPEGKRGQKRPLQQEPEHKSKAKRLKRTEVKQEMPEPEPEPELETKQEQESLSEADQLGKQIVTLEKQKRAYKASGDFWGVQEKRNEQEKLERQWKLLTGKNVAEELLNPAYARGEIL